MNAETISLLFLAIMLLVVVLGSLSLALLASGNKAGLNQARSPQEILLDRYARGELTRQQYYDALVDILKDRYIRSELTIEEYEARLDLLLSEPHGMSRPEAKQRQQLSTNGQAGAQDYRGKTGTHSC